MEGIAKTFRLHFSAENCATCQGVKEQPPCFACHGKGKLLVLQPSMQCPRCGGSGKPEPASSWLVDYCVVCHGTGWVWTEFHLDESTIRRAAIAFVKSRRQFSTEI